MKKTRKERRIKETRKRKLEQKLERLARECEDEEYFQLVADFVGLKKQKNNTSAEALTDLFVKLKINRK